MIRSFLESLEPDQHVLFFAIAPRISDDMLEEIARADYGLDEEQHLVALQRLRDTGELVEPFHWFPCEVLELMRNSAPEDPSWKPGSAGQRGHWIRVFASAALLRAAGPPWNYSADAAQPSYNLIQLLRSVEALPVDLSQQVIQWVAWFLLQADLEGQDEQPLYFGVALLWMVLRHEYRVGDDELIQLSEWIVSREEALRHERPWAFDRWLLGIAHDPPPSRWEWLGGELLRLDLGGHRQQLQEWVKLIGSELSGQDGE